MSFIMTIFLHYLDEYTSFKCFCNIIGTTFYKQFAVFQMNNLNVYFKVYQYLFQKYEKELFDYFAEKGAVPEIYALEWFITLFSKNCPIELEYRILDCYLSEKEVFLYKCAIAYLKLYKEKFFELDLGKILELLKCFPSDIDVEKYFSIIESIPIKSHDLQNLCITVSKD